MFSKKQIANYFLNVLEQRTGKTRLRSYPVVLDIVPTLLCNINCIFCIEYPVNGSKHLTVDTFNQIVKKIFPYPLRINFCSGGEPFLNKNMMEFLAICKSHNIDNKIITNGTLLTEDICKGIITDSNVGSFNFSFDGAKKDTVESIRLGVDYDKVVTNMQVLSELKKKYRKHYPSLNIRCAIMKKNIEELPDLIRYSKKWGIQKVIVNYVSITEKMDKKESLYYNPKITEKVFNECIAVAKSKGVQLSLPPFMTEDHLISKCHSCYLPWYFMKIDPDGFVRFCYRAWNNPIGNIRKVKDFTSLWNNVHYRLVRKTVNTDKPYYKYCSICSERKGLDQAISHFQNIGEYEFDKDFEKTHKVKIPQRIGPIDKSFRGLKVVD